MNRKEEFEQMLREMDQAVPGLESPLERALQRRRKREKRTLRSAVGLAACMAGFILAVNFCTPVAHACSNVPILRELAAVVMFSQSLTAAVEEDYVQPVGLVQTEGDITAQVEYLIVDRKQINVFYRLNSDKYEKISVDPVVLSLDDEAPLRCAYEHVEMEGEGSDLCCLRIYFTDSDVPECLRVKLDIYAGEEVWPIEGGQIASHLTAFDFLLEIDPMFRESGKVIPVNESVRLKDQTITITDVEIYPTHMRVDVKAADANPAWLTELSFHIETGDGRKFEGVSEGLVGTYSEDSLTLSLWLESAYFCEADQLELVIAGAVGQDKAEENPVRIVLF